MSKIVAVVKGISGERRTEVLARLRAITGWSLAEIIRRLASGEPMMEVVLFLNDHEEVAQRLRQVVSEMPPLGARLQLFEIAPDESSHLLPHEQEISIEMLLNILNSSEETKRHRQEMWDKHGHI